MKSKKQSKSRTRRKKLGNWKIKRYGDRELLITIPKGMSIKANNISIEDLLGAISNYIVVKKGRVLSCCSGNVAIA